MKKQDEVQFDTRTLEQAMRAGKLSKKEIDEYLKKLPDESKNAQEQKVFNDEEEPYKNGSSGPTFTAVS
ncbi:MAG: hypothetical protein Q7S68_05555 [Deltaproteobacteria bacterium]|nr:hypothetical protein [Deltaproteobacteria bacterium]